MIKHVRILDKDYCIIVKTAWLEDVGGMEEVSSF